MSARTAAPLCCLCSWGFSFSSLGMNEFPCEAPGSPGIIHPAFCREPPPYVMGQVCGAPKPGADSGGIGTRRERSRAGTGDRNPGEPPRSIPASRHPLPTELRVPLASPEPRLGSGWWSPKTLLCHAQTHTHTQASKMISMAPWDVGGPRAGNASGGIGGAPR